MPSVMDRMFGKTKTPEEMAKEWKTKMRSEARGIDRQILHINREEAKVQKSLKDAAKQGNQTAARTLARELVNSRKAKNRLYAAKAQLNSVQMQLQNQMSQMKLMGTMQKSAQIMQAMNSLCRVGEMQQVMQSMSKEMMKAGLIEEMMEDAFEGDVEEDDVEDEVQAVLDDVLGQKLSDIQPTTGIKKPAASQAVADEPAEEEEGEDELAQRLAALKAS